jgi:hypothetical protein
VTNADVYQFVSKTILQSQTHQYTFITDASKADELERIMAVALNQVKTACQKN